MVLSQYNGEEAIEKLADLMEPAAKIMQDKELVNEVKGKNSIRAIKIALKNHAREVIEIMAVLKGKDASTYKPTLFELPAMLLELLNDEEVINLFTLQGQKEEIESSGSATANTGAEEA